MVKEKSQSWLEVNFLFQIIRNEYVHGWAIKAIPGLKYKGGHTLKLKIFVHSKTRLTIIIHVVSKQENLTLALNKSLYVYL